MLDLGIFTNIFFLILTMMEMSDLLNANWVNLDYFSLLTGV